MNASTRYLPISLAVCLSLSCQAVFAGSALDPYSHIKPPQAAQPKKKAPVAPAMNDDPQPATYVTMPMGNLSEDNKSKGIIGKTMAGMTAPFKTVAAPLKSVPGVTAPIKSASSGVAKSGKLIGGGIASSAKASTDLAKKSVTAVGSGFKSTGDKLKDGTSAVTSKIALKPKKKPSANKTASVDDWYAREAQKTIASSSDGGKHASELIKKDHSKTAGGIDRAYLPPSSKQSKFGIPNLNPFGKLAKKGKPVDDSTLRPASGFVDGALNPDEETPTEVAHEKKSNKPAATPAPQTAQQATPTQHHAVAQTAKPKKSKFGSFSVAKLKPSMPSLSMPAIPGFKRDKKAQPMPGLVASTPKIDNAEHASRTPTTAAANGAEKDLAGSATTGDTTAFRTGDKEIDAAMSHNAAPGKTAVASQPRKGKVGGMTNAMKGSFSRFNLLSKKKKPSMTATKSDAAKPL